ncbi:hypothetical protein GCM10027300_24590 [Modestobacter lapidis]
MQGRRTLRAMPAAAQHGVRCRTEFTDGFHVERHRDGSIRVRGRVVDGRPDGYREWFRLDGTVLRSGSYAASPSLRAAGIAQVTDCAVLTRGAAPDPMRRPTPRPW